VPKEEGHRLSTVTLHAHSFRRSTPCDREMRASGGAWGRPTPQRMTQPDPTTLRSPQTLSRTRTVPGPTTSFPNTALREAMWKAFAGMPISRGADGASSSAVRWSDPESPGHRHIAALRGHQTSRP